MTWNLAQFHSRLRPMANDIPFIKSASSLGKEVSFVTLTFAYGFKLITETYQSFATRPIITILFR